MNIPRRVLPLAFALAMGALSSSIVAVQAADSTAGAPAAAAIAPDDTASGTDSAGAAANCGMGSGGDSCCQACQQRARLVKEGKAKEKSGSCPCQRARELREKQ